MAKPIHANGVCKSFPKGYMAKPSYASKVQYINLNKLRRVYKMKRPEIKDLTLREKIAQLLIVRQSDLVQDASTSYTKFRAPEEAAQIMEKNQFGGIWLHGNVDVNQINDVWNKNVNYTVEELRAWYEEVRKNVKIPVICAGDTGRATGMSSFPSGLAIGASSDPDAAFKLGSCLAGELSHIGQDWIWSPIADYGNRRGSGIGRQYSNIPDDMIRCAIGYMKGFHSKGMVTTLKHFPGSDPYETRDSHIVTTFMKNKFEDWEKGQGRIFQEIIDAGVDSVMVVAHSWPEVDDTQVNGRYLPAGLSYKITTELLKEKMGFKGVVITDDVTMGGFTSFYSGGRLYAEFIKAGNDMLLGVGVDAVDLIEEEVKKGILTEERIDEAVERVFDLKEKVGLFDKGYRKPDWTFEEAKAETAKTAKEIAETSLTLIRDRQGAIPFNKNEIKNVAIVCYTHREPIFAALDAMKEEFEKYGCNVTKYRRLNSFEEAKEVADNNDLIVYVGYIGFHAPKGAPSFYGDEFWALRHAFVYGVEKSIGISLGHPHIHYDFMDDALMFVNAYNPASETQKAFVRGVFGDIPFVGKSPVELD